MKLNHRWLETRSWTQLLLGSACMLGLGCGDAATDPLVTSNTDSDPVTELGQELRGRGFGHGPRRSHRGRRGHRPTPPPAPAPCDVGSLDDLLQAINADLVSRDADDQPFTRYFSLRDRASKLGCGSELDGERAALSKMLNSVSIEPTLAAPLAVDADQTLFRIDLRDYSLDRALSVGGQRFPDGWEALLAAVPSALELVGDDADDAKSDTQTAVPVLFGSAFIAAAARAPLYYSLLGIPADVDDFLSEELGVDVAGGEGVRAGFSAAAQGGQRELLAERFDLGTRIGYVWQISEFGGSLFEDPLGSPSGERELSFTLPNGLLGHVLADGNGRVRSASNVLIDAAEADGRARIATSFFASRAQGVDVSDEVRNFVLANPGEFDPAERAAILALYPAAAELEEILANDRDQFVARALQQINLDIASEPDPITRSFRDFSAPVDAATAAGELFVSADELLDNLDLLDPSLAPLAGGTVSRERFDAAYLSALCTLGVTAENQVDQALCD